MRVTFAKIAPISKRDSLNRMIKEAIASGMMSSGEPIVEAKVARQFGVGHGLVREALLELECEGFVQRTPFANTRVAILGDVDARHVFDIRIELEPLAFELAARNPATQRDSVSLQELTARSRDAANSGNIACFFKNHLDLFRKVWGMSGNRFLHQSLERVVVPLFSLYLTQMSFACQTLMRDAIACSELQEAVLQELVAGNAPAVKQMVCDCLIQMKALVEPPQKG